MQSLYNILQFILTSSFLLQGYFVPAILISWLFYTILERECKHFELRKFDCYKF